MTLLSGGRYYRGVVTIGGSLLSGGRYYWGVATIGGALLSEFYGIALKS